MTSPECASASDVERLDGAHVAVVGVYEQVDVRARATPPPVYAGHAAVRLGDGTRVLIEPMWSTQARRDDDEIARAEGRTVRVLGVLHAQAPEPPEPMAVMLGPCVADVDDVVV